MDYKKKYLKYKLKYLQTKQKFKGGSAENGDIYNGELANGIPHGYGVMNYVNNDIYIGNWSNGQKHGHGTLQERKTVIDAVTKKPKINQFTGENNLSISKTYQGMWENDKKHGKGTLQSSQVKMEGTWKDDTPNPDYPVKLTYADTVLDGTPRQETYWEKGYINKNCKKHGTFILSTITGRRRPLIITYDNGIETNRGPIPPLTNNRK